MPSNRTRPRTTSITVGQWSRFAAITCSARLSTSLETRVRGTGCKIGSQPLILCRYCLYHLAETVMRFDYNTLAHAGIDVACKYKCTGAAYDAMPSEITGISASCPPPGRHIGALHSKLHDSQCKVPQQDFIFANDCRCYLVLGSTWTWGVATEKRENECFFHLVWCRKHPSG